MKQFIYCEFEEESNPVQFLDRVERIALELENIDAGLPQKIVSSQFIEKLSDDYGVIKQIFGGEVINRQELIVHVSSRHAETAIASESSALFARLSKEVIYSNYGRTGHLANECKNLRSWTEELPLALTVVVAVIVALVQRVLARNHTRKILTRRLLLLSLMM